MAEVPTGREGSVEPGQPNHPKIVSNPVEAEHMAHAMDPHYEQASRIDELNARSHEIARKDRERDVSSPLRDDSTDRATIEARGNEVVSWAERQVSVQHERTALDDAADAARKAGDAAGDQTSIAYRHDHQGPPEES